jgi:hypothetical protein
LALGLVVTWLAIGGGAGSTLPAAYQPPTTAQLLAESTLSWTAAASETNPPPLVGASAVYDNDDQTIVLFGGRLADGALSNDTWVWTGSRWIEFAGSKIQAPPARQLAAMAFDPTLHQLIVFGGIGADGQLFDDTWAWNGVSWYQIGAPLTSDSPPPLAGASMSYDPAGDLVLFGGTVAASPSQSTVSTTTAPTTIAPTTTATAPGTTAGTGSGTSGTSGQGNTPNVPASIPPTSPPTSEPDQTGSVPSTLGSPTTVSSSSTWIWTATGWLQESVPGPPARSDASIVYDSTSDQTVLFGGQTNPVGTSGGKLLSDTWLWTGSTWTQAKPKTSPAARTAAMASDEPGLAAALLYGGTGAKSDLSDLWLWSGSTWLSAKASETPAGRHGAAVAYDTATDATVLFGGSISGILSGSTDLLSATLTADSTPTSVGSASSVPTTTSRSESSDGSHASASTTIPSTGPPGVVITAPLVAPLDTTARTVRPGASVTLFGSGFVPGAVVTITFHSTPQQIGTAKADANGQFSATVTVPDSAAAGHHHLVASGATPSGSTEILTAALVVAGAPLSIPIPRSETVTLVAAALAFPAGAWLAMSGAGWLRRRRPRNVAS